MESPFRFGYFRSYVEKKLRIESYPVILSESLLKKLVMIK